MFVPLLSKAKSGESSINPLVDGNYAIVGAVMDSFKPSKGKNANKTTWFYCMAFIRLDAENKPVELFKVHLKSVCPSKGLYIDTNNEPHRPTGNIAEEIDRIDAQNRGDYKDAVLLNKILPAMRGKVITVKNDYFKAIASNGEIRNSYVYNLVNADATFDVNAHKAQIVSMFTANGFADRNAPENQTEQRQKESYKSFIYYDYNIQLQIAE